MTLCNRKYGAHYSLKAAPWKSGGGANVPRYPSTMKHGFKKTLWIFFYYRGCHLIVSCVGMGFETFLEVWKEESDVIDSIRGCFQIFILFICICQAPSSLSIRPMRTGKTALPRYLFTFVAKSLLKISSQSCWCSSTLQTIKFYYLR